MSEITKIQWCDSTANPVTGCSKACYYCYARRSAPRFHGGTYGHKPKYVLHEGAFAMIRRLAKRPWICNRCGRGFPERRYHFCSVVSWHRRRIFYSYGDWLDRWPKSYLVRFLRAIHDAESCDFLLLTKFPEEWRRRIGLAELTSKDNWVRAWLDGQAPSNVWVGTTCENQTAADLRIPELLRIPAVKRFVSFEPMTGPIDTHIRDFGNTLTPTYMGLPYSHDAKIDWAIIGGMSGRKAAPCNVEWIRSLLKQCKHAKVPAFCKQLGSNPWMLQDDGRGMELTPIKLHHPKGGDPTEWPEDLRVREFPT